MELFWFQRFENFNFKELSKELSDAGFNGILFPYSADGPDHFISIANNIIKEDKIKYMVAIRPYAISPQYINKIIKGINKISKNRILINFVSGWIYDYEKTLGGVHGNINALSSNIERSDYLIDYLETLNNMDDNQINFYVSVTNQTMLEKTKKYNVIVPYVWYKKNNIDISKLKAIISICPVVRTNKEDIDNLKNNSISQKMVYFTEEEFMQFLFEIKSIGIDGLLIFEDLENTEKSNILKLIKKSQTFLKEKK